MATPPFCLLQELVALYAGKLFCSLIFFEQTLKIQIACPEIDSLV